MPGNFDANHPLFVRDIVVIGDKGDNADRVVAGEFGFPPNGEDPNHLIDRLFMQIKEMATGTNKEHQAIKYDAGGNPSGIISRLVTNEFFFYTREPLSIEQFEDLQRRIVDEAKKWSEDVHLVLGSFAVSTPLGEVMNVVPHIECGLNPRVNLIVKNHPSHIDPAYCKEDNNGIVNLMPNVTSDVNEELTEKGKLTDISDLSITIEGKSIPFSFNNVLECQAVNGAHFYSCIDICLDHDYGIAKENLNKKLMEETNPSHLPRVLPQQCLHTIVSNSVALVPEHCIGLISFVDPYWARHSYFLVGNEVIEEYKSSFPGILIIKKPSQLMLLPPDQLSVVEKNNSLVAESLQSNNRSQPGSATQYMPLTGHALQQSQETIAEYKQKVQDLKNSNKENGSPSNENGKKFIFPATLC